MRKAVSLLALVVAASAAQAQGFKAVWLAGPNDIWGAGTSGTLMHGLNGAWTALPSGVQSDLNGIWGAAANDVWVVGESGTILRWNGTAVRRVLSPQQVDWIAVAGCNANDVWVLGQSEDQSQPPPLVRWNGTAWTPQTLPVNFRASSLTLNCGGVTAAGGGSGGPMVVGTTFFDPRPTERRTVGVVARFQNGAWTTQGWNGRTVTDSQLGGNGWTSAFTNGSATLLAGGDSGNVLLLSGRTGRWTRLPAPPAEFQRAILLGDGTPVLLMRDGFAKLMAGQWQVTGGTQQGSQRNEAAMERIRARMEAISREIQAGRATQANITELTQLQQQYMQAATGQSGTTEQIMQQQLGQARQNAALAFGDNPGVFVPRTGTDFYVATGNGSIVRVSGTSATIIHSPMCASSPQMCGR